jgi:hypothetical protein
MAVNVIVHLFTMGDVEDPEIYAAQPIWEWQQTEAGKWVMENAIEEPYWARYIDHTTYSYQYKIVAKLTEANATWYKLKYDYPRNT